MCVCVEGCSIKQVNIQQGHHPADEFLKFSLEKRQKLVKMRYEYFNKNEKNTIVDVWREKSGSK